MQNVTEVRRGKQTRQSFGRIREVMDIPNLIEVQKSSFRWFLETGLREVFRDIDVITDFSKNWELTFVDYRLDDKPKYSVIECKEREATYAAPMKVRARLRNMETGVVKESEIYMGDFPLMTDSGTFVVNGAERVIVSQLVRSPGVYFGRSYDKTGIPLYSGTINPNRGAWLEYETDINDLFYVRIDKNRKLFITTFIRALALYAEGEVKDLNLDTDEGMKAFFGYDPRIAATLEKDIIQNEGHQNAGEAAMEVYRKMRPGESVTLEIAQQNMHNLFFDPYRYDISRVGRYKYNKKLAISSRLAGCKLVEPIADVRTGEILADAGQVIDKMKAYEIEQAGVTRAVVELPDGNALTIHSNGMVDIKGRKDLDTEEDIRYFDFLPDVTEEELAEIGITEKVTAKVFFEILDAAKTNAELLAELKKRKEELIPKNITVTDILASINYINCLAFGIGKADDIDHLGNRRIRCVGELLQNQFRLGISRMEKLVREKMGLQAQDDADKITPATLVNIRPVTSAIKEFFGSSPLSQFMDQINPLSELTHKRRLSALGPGGLSRDRAGFEVRDVHYSHYGRMCPIETPEGANVGLISYLATYARINRYGFIEAPYRRVQDGIVSDDIRYMTADEEDDYIVAQANEPLTAENTFVKKNGISARHRDEYLETEPSAIQYMDVSPKMVVSVATAMIPFLENDDANRALMGSNMQRQAVPLLQTEAPFIGTGMEYKAATDSGVVVKAEEAGTVTYVDANKITIMNAKGVTKTYELIKYLRSNAGTCINQKPVVELGEAVAAEQVIADGPATNQGEISLGKNALIGFMTWEGYNYEDAVLVNEKIVQDDMYTSIHIERFEQEARDTKLGAEEITRDIPNVGDDALRDLDDRGIVRIGAEVKSGDILVGKVTPKGDTDLTAEERLLRAIFGEKVKEVRDTSLRLPHGEYGIVVNTEVFTRENSDELSPGVNMVVRVYVAQKRKLSVGDKMAGRHGNKGVVSRILPQEDMPYLEDGTPLDIVLNPLGVPSRMNIGQVLEVHLGLAARLLGLKFMTPVFDGAHEDNIREALREAAKNLQAAGSKLQVYDDGKLNVYDGRTGRKFDNRITVGVMYFLKLLHLVDDKIHARSTGPYSLVTQQPLGGKAQFGGQRFGEMEVWALEAYGAAYTLQEILTVKSDDVVGRVKTYEAIVKGKNVPTPGIPESFKVLVKELQSLALDVRILDEEGEEIDIKNNYDTDPTFGSVDNNMVTSDPADLEIPEEDEAEESDFAEEVSEEIEDDEVFAADDAEDEDLLDDYSEGFDEDAEEEFDPEAIHADLTVDIDI
ncbi:MAG: DNA-directed RNA polymerase subunit beta [Oscillospiraceae bacterium]|jgi:DNA-directed RNA polymerase subunit beta|nr:DNA-directed RNA polymerase subunit beta [Oscillospiraceae bacterium]